MSVDVFARTGRAEDSTSTRQTPSRSGVTVVFVVVEILSRGLKSYPKVLVTVEVAGPQARVSRTQHSRSAPQSTGADANTRSTRCMSATSQGSCLHPGPRNRGR